MSSPEDGSPPSTSVSEQLKKKKKQRACDFCRRKKIRCDGAEMPEHRCSRCIGQGIECTYEPINTRPPSKSYVQILENRLQNMEKLFEQLHPNIQIPKDFDGMLEANRLRTAAEASLAMPSPSPLPSASSSAGAVSPPPPDDPPSIDSELEPSDDEREAKLNIVSHLRRLPIPRPDDHQYRYHGKSSNLMFLQTVIDAKQKFSNSAGVGRPRSADAAFPLSPPVPHRDPVEIAMFPKWFSRAVSLEDKPHQDFPPRDLIDHLADKYFEQINVYLPLLHRPTFDKALNEGRHTRNRAFGTIVLLICANGSRWSDDPRVQSEDGRDPGWRWFEKAEQARWVVLARSTLEDLQTCVLMAMYLASSNTPQGSWTIIGLGIRMTQDLGYHRRKTYSSKPTVQDELKKRAFWILVTLDRIGSLGLGRPCAIHDEDFDVDPLLEVDDEYWISDDPEQAFKQPDGIPSRISFINCFIRLQKILAFASRTIYSINKSKLSLGFVGPEWEQRIVAELDSALNKWIDTVPDHLRWDPECQDKLTLDQSATLYANYYLAQICIHRPFIPSPRKPSRLPFPSLTICTNAARSCTHVLDVHYQRSGQTIILNRLPIFTAGLVLLLNMWGSKKSGVTEDPNIVDVRKCMDILKGMERYTYSAGRLWDVLHALLTMADFNLLPSQQMQGSNAQSTLNNTTSGLNSESMFSIFSPSRSEVDTGSPATVPGPGAGIDSRGIPAMQVEPAMGLPVYTSDLGRMPFTQTQRHHPSQQQMLPPGPEFLASMHAQQAHADVQAQSFFQGIQMQSQAQAVPSPFTAGGSGGLATQQSPLRNVNAAAYEGHMPDRPLPFTTRLTEYSELLSALSSAPASAGNPPMSHRTFGGVQSSPDPESAAMFALMAAAGGGDSGEANAPTNVTTGGANGPEDDGDVAMMSVDGFAFPDTTMEMWSSAPTSFEWNDWGAYLGTMGGMGNPFAFPADRGL